MITNPAFYVDEWFLTLIVDLPHMASKIKLFNKKLGVGKKHKSHIEVTPKAVVAPAQVTPKVSEPSDVMSILWRSTCIIIML